MHITFEDSAALYTRSKHGLIKLYFKKKVAIGGAGFIYIWKKIAIGGAGFIYEKIAIGGAGFIYEKKIAIGGAGFFVYFLRICLMTQWKIYSAPALRFRNCGI